MRAAVLHTPGEPPRYDSHPDAPSADGMTVVSMTGAPVVPLDLLCASGTSYFGRPQVPYVPGVQGVGVVVASARHPAGAPVWISTSAGMAPGDGAMAELCAVPDADVVPIGSDVDQLAMAALGLSAVAAWMSLTWRARVQPGEQVLVLGAGGAVGQSAIGAAKALGAGKVVAVCRSATAQERAQRAGADEVIALTEDLDVLTERLTAATTGSVDVVVDPVFGVAATAACRVLAPGGRIVNIGGASGDVAELSSAVIRSRSADLLGYTNNSLSSEQRRDAIQAIAGHAAAGRMRVEHEPMQLADVAEAWTRQASGNLEGRIVLTPSA